MFEEVFCSTPYSRRGNDLVCFMKNKLMSFFSIKPGTLDWYQKVKQLVVLPLSCQIFNLPLDQIAPDIRRKAMAAASVCHGQSTHGGAFAGTPPGGGTNAIQEH